jgi:hypothetical protein
LVGLVGGGTGPVTWSAGWESIACKTLHLFNLQPARLISMSTLGVPLNMRG